MYRQLAKCETCNPPACLMRSGSGTAIARRIVPRDVAGSSRILPRGSGSESTGMGALVVAEIAQMIGVPQLRQTFISSFLGRTTICRLVYRVKIRDE